MNTLVLYYSYTGHTRKLAEELAAAENAALCPIEDQKRPGTIKAYTAGSLAARSQSAWPIKPITYDLNQYDRIILLAPIWAGYPAPQVNSVLNHLPAGKKVKVCLISGSGKSACKEKLSSLIQSKGCQLDGYEDIKG